jgi:hypothetical protein
LPQVHAFLTTLIDRSIRLRRSLRRASGRRNVDRHQI